MPYTKTKASRTTSRRYPTRQHAKPSQSTARQYPTRHRTQLERVVIDSEPPKYPSLAAAKCPHCDKILPAASQRGAHHATAHGSPMKDCDRPQCQLFSRPRRSLASRRDLPCGHLNCGTKCQYVSEPTGTASQNPPPSLLPMKCHHCNEVLRGRASLKTHHARVHSCPMKDCDWIECRLLSQPHHSLASRRDLLCGHLGCSTTCKYLPIHHPDRSVQPSTCPHDGCSNTLSGRMGVISHHFRVHGTRIWECEHVNCKDSCPTFEGPCWHPGRGTICRFKDPTIQTTMCPHSRCQRILANRSTLVKHHKNIHGVAGKDCAELQCRSYFEQNLRVVYAAARRGVAPQSSDSTTTVPSSYPPLQYPVNWLLAHTLNAIKSWAH